MEEANRKHQPSIAARIIGSCPCPPERERRISTTDHLRSFDARAMTPGLTLQSFEHLDEKRILRRCDIRILPVLAILYLMSFLDRGNIGNAQIQGIERDLNLTGSRYNWALSVFFFGYALCDIPSNLLLKKVRPSIWLPTIMVAWGTVTTLMGIVQGFRSLIATRFFLGVTEAGLYPGATFYITLWYRREEALWRQAVFFSSASIAGAFSRILAFGIAKMDGVAGLAGWRWIFLIEGLLTLILALLAFPFLHDFPATAKFLTEEERVFMVHRLRYQGQVMGEDGRMVPQTDEFSWKYVRDAFLDWQIWLSGLVFWGIQCPLYGIALFLPSIINGLGYKSSTAQLMTVPVYCAAAVVAIATAYFSDRKGYRSPFILGCFFVMLVGFTMCVATDDPGVVYAGCFIAACAIYPAYPANVTWLSNNLAGTSKRAAGMAIQIGLGALGGAAASNFYRDDQYPSYTLGHSLVLVFVSVGIVATIVQVVCYKMINKRRTRLFSEGAHFGLTPEQLSAQGDKAVTYRYFL